jgi:hypothetical protein
VTTPRLRLPGLRRPAFPIAALCLSLGVGACQPPTPRLPPIAPPAPPTLTVAQAAALIPSKVSDRNGWAHDAFDALRQIDQLPTAENVCQVFAVVEQESGFRANPEVANLAKIVAAELDTKARAFGPLGPPAVRWLLSAKAKGSDRTFEQRLAAARTEADLDRTFRALVAHWREHAPVSTAVASLASRLFADRGLEDLNPITTAGSMQVAVAFAIEHADGAREDTVREELYTRAGGLRHGVARLLGYEASYDDPLYRFADFNAGPYASRNAAVQEQLAGLLGVPLVPDGDLLIYGRDGAPLRHDSKSLQALLAFAKVFAPELQEITIRRDLAKEKREDFESTTTYRELRKVLRARSGRTAAYARVPQITLSSPKLSRDRTTDWFARAVDRRYDRCLAAARSLAARDAG